MARRHACVPGAHGRAGDPRRRGGDRAGRSRGGALASAWAGHRAARRRPSPPAREDRRRRRRPARAGADGPAEPSQVSARIVRALPAGALALTLLGAWELYANLANVEADVLPAPHAVAASLWNNG